MTLTWMCAYLLPQKFNVSCRRMQACYTQPSYVVECYVHYYACVTIFICVYHRSAPYGCHSRFVGECVTTGVGHLHWRWGGPRRSNLLVYVRSHREYVFVMTKDFKLSANWWSTHFKHQIHWKSQTIYKAVDTNLSFYWCLQLRSAVLLVTRHLKDITAKNQQQIMHFTVEVWREWNTSRPNTIRYGHGVREGKQKRRERNRPLLEWLVDVVISHAPSPHGSNLIPPSWNIRYDLF